MIKWIRELLDRYKPVSSTRSFLPPNRRRQADEQLATAMKDLTDALNNRKKK